MRTSNGFDRMSTREELHQVLAVLDEFARSARTVPGEEQEDSLATALWASIPEEDLVDIESWAEFAADKPELKN